MENSNNALPVISALLIGAAIGGVLGILFAPAKGTDTRKKICKKGEDYSDAVKEKFDDILDSISEKFEKVKEEVSDFAEECKVKIKSEKE